jgi:predicted nucleic acid-binding protein
LELVPISAQIIETATVLRARHRFLKTPDAIHLASASLSACDVFLTHDRALERCAELRVEIMAG